VRKAKGIRATVNVARMLFTLLLFAAESLVAVTVATSILPPVLPVFFQGNFTEFTAPIAGSPPYVNGIPPAPFRATRGAVFYDWSLKSMIEERYDHCINIFPGGFDFPCTFHNVNGTSYLITFNKTRQFPPCCVFGQPWSPPNPFFLRDNVTAVLARSEEWDCVEDNWWTVPTIKPPTGPFWYAFRKSDENSTLPQVYHSFAFPGMSGWIEQNFWNVRHTRPAAPVWKLPAECQPVATLPNCGFFSIN
jgi:hypothetical protein